MSYTLLFIIIFWKNWGWRYNIWNIYVCKMCSWFLSFSLSDQGHNCTYATRHGKRLRWSTFYIVPWFMNAKLQPLLFYPDNLGIVKTLNQTSTSHFHKIFQWKINEKWFALFSPCKRIISLTIDNPISNLGDMSIPRRGGGDTESSQVIISWYI